MNIYIHPVTGHCVTCNSPVMGYDKMEDFCPTEEEEKDPLFKKIFKEIRYWTIESEEMGECSGSYNHACMLLRAIKNED